MEGYDVVTLIQNSIDPSIVGTNPDLGLFMEVADKINSTPEQCREGCREILSYLKHKDKQCRWHAILLIECLVKNCKMKFHYELLSKTFNEITMKILAKRRKVKAIYYTLVSKHPIQQDIEDKLLYLIQLWFDTFMMHEGEFKEIIALYKHLRKEGVVFPARDSTAKYMIQFKGQESPIFQTIEENKVYEEPTKQLRAAGGKVGPKDFISASYGNPTGGIGSSTNSKRPAYIGQNYEAQQEEQDRYMEEEVEQNYHLEADEVV